MKYFILICSLMMLMACSSTVPIVKEVTSTPDGVISVTSCDLVYSPYFGNKIKLKNCTTK